jgi:thiol-disulfide isomerase/thioredoxin
VTSSVRSIDRFSVAATLGLVLMVAATAGYIGWPRVANAIGLKPAPPPPAYAAGQPVDVPAAWYDAAPKTLIIFGRSSCVACEKAQPFLKGLVTRLNGRAAAVFAHPHGEDEADATFAKSLGVTSDRIVVAGPGLRVRATPTLVLVDKNGTVLEAWEGAGPPEKQSSILKAIDVALR